MALVRCKSNPGQRIALENTNNVSNKTMKSATSFLVLGLCALAGIAPGQQSIDWWTVDGGGGTSTGGVFTVSGTIGQPDAGAMSGGQFSVTGGFWAVAAVQTPALPTLFITPAGQGRGTLTWSPDTHGFHLQVSTTLNPPVWTNAPSGATNPITVPTMGAMRFYRLVKP
jgi:hypothetical protein